MPKQAAMIESVLSVVVWLLIAVFTHETAKRIFRNVTPPSIIDTRRGTPEWCLSPPVDRISGNLLTCSQAWVYRHLLIETPSVG